MLPWQAVGAEAALLEPRILTVLLHRHSMQQPPSAQSGTAHAAALLPHMHRPLGRRGAQFAVWYLTLVFSRRGIQGYWSPSLIAPDAADNFWLAVCAGACMVRRSPSASWSATAGADHTSIRLMNNPPNSAQRRMCSRIASQW